MSQDSKNPERYTLEKEKLKTDFLEYIEKNPKVSGESPSDYQARLIQMYTEASGVQDSEKIKELQGELLKIFIVKKEREEAKNIDAYYALRTGKITQEEYDKKVEQAKQNENKEKTSQKEESSHKDSIPQKITQERIVDYKGGKAIQTPEGKNISITLEEAKIAEENPEALKNIINFYTFFKELNLE